MIMFDNLKKMSKVFLILAILSAVCVVAVGGYVFYDLNYPPFILFCSFCILIFIPTIFAALSYLSKTLAKDLLKFDMTIQQELDQK